MCDSLPKNRLITVLGATAIGKTSLGVKLAKHFNCDVLSCDSRQFYKEMTIGTGVPSEDELMAVNHHFIQSRSVFEPYNVGQFEKEALDKLSQLFKKQSTQIMVGGSGLYADAVLNGLDYFPEVPSKIRTDLHKELEDKGIESLQKRLKRLDEKTYLSIDIQNHQRVIRALEICIGTGVAFSSFKDNLKSPRDFIPIKIGLNADREILYDRINRRVDEMIEKGLLEEAEKMHPDKNLNALQTVGYKELFSYFDGDFTLDFAISEIKKNTRRFAKRQLTWFRKDPTITWFDFETDTSQIIDYIDSFKGDKD